MNFASLHDGTIAGRLLRLPLRLIPGDCSLRILGGPLRGKKWIAGSGNHGCWLGIYEPEAQEVFETCVPRGGVVYDVGAHVGFHTLLASVLAGPEGKVYAFEPAPRNVGYLQEHLRINRVSNVEVLPCAVAECAGNFFFHEGTNSSTGHLAIEGSFTVHAVSLDECIVRLRLLPPDFLKIDVEGAEARVLHGAQCTLRTARPLVLVEAHGAERRDQALHLLEGLGYSVRPVLAGPGRETNLYLALPDAWGETAPGGDSSVEHVRRAGD